jgi:uncharacterized protein (TIGR00255 family)
MTGFGRGAASDERYHVTVEIKCVNHRYSDLSFRLPRDLGRLEEPLRRLVKETVRRGRVDLYLTVADAPQAARAVVVDVALARGYLDALRALCSDLDLRDEVRLDHLLRASDVLRAPAVEAATDALDALAVAAAEQALAAVLSMREREGRALRADLDHRLGRLLELRSLIAARAQGLVPLWRERLLARATELLAGREVALDPGRLEQEVAVYADRSDVSEELVRWQSHIQQMAAALDASGEEPVGRRLDFLCQEALREVNTVGSKALDSEIASCIIAAKEELERVREQLQNIE